jgi:hypothetical protein
MAAPAPPPSPINPKQPTAPPSINHHPLSYHFTKTESTNTNTQTCKRTRAPSPLPMAKLPITVLNPIEAPTTEKRRKKPADYNHGSHKPISIITIS